MTKKKNGFFSNIKSKFMKNKNDDHQPDDTIEDYEFSEDEEFIEEDESDEVDDTEIDETDDVQDKHNASLSDGQSMHSAHSELEEDEESESEEYEEEEYEDDEYEDESIDRINSDDTSSNIEMPKKKPFFANLMSKIKSSKDETIQTPVVSPTATRTLINPFAKTSEPITKSGLKASNSLKDLTLDQVVPYFLGSSNQKMIHKSFLVFLAFSFFYVFGKVTGILLSKKAANEKVVVQATPVPSYSPRSDITAIKNNNIFNVRENEFEDVKVAKPKEPEIKICLEANKKTSLPIKLVNSIVLQDSVKSIVSVTQRGKTENFREGEKIGSMAEIGKIDRLRVIFKNLQSGQCEFIESSDKPIKAESKAELGVIPAKKVTTPIKSDEIETDGNKFAIKKSLRDKLLSNIGEVLTQARAIQIKNPDGTLSFKMTEIVPGSIFTNLSIQDGDLVTGINGKKIESVNEMMAMFGKLKETDTYEITVNRNGTETNLNYNFVE